MLARLGNVIYGIGCLVAAFYLFAGLTDDKMGRLLFVISVISFSIGWAIRYVLSGNKGLKF